MKIWGSGKNKNGDSIDWNECCSTNWNDGRNIIDGFGSVNKINKYIPQEEHFEIYKDSAKKGEIYGNFKNGTGNSKKHATDDRDNYEEVFLDRDNYEEDGQDNYTIITQDSEGEDKKHNYYNYYNDDKHNIYSYNYDKHNNYNYRKYHEYSCQKEEEAKCTSNNYGTNTRNVANNINGSENRNDNRCIFSFFFSKIFRKKKNNRLFSKLLLKNVD